MSEPQAASSGNTREIGPATTGSIGNMASREEQPATIGRPKAAPGASLPRASVARDASRRSGSAGGATRSGDCSCARLTIAAAPQRPANRMAQTSQRRRTTSIWLPSLSHMPMSDSSAAVTAPVVASGYAVQVTSERSESRAQAAFRALQAKYPNQLSGHQPIIRRADLGAAGIYYRALVGPFASAEKAAKMCSGLKAAGGDCIIQKN